MTRQDFEIVKARLEAVKKVLTIENYNQDTYGDNVYKDKELCGTVCCIGGHLVHNSNPELYKKLASYNNQADIQKQACKLLKQVYTPWLFDYRFDLKVGRAEKYTIYHAHMAINMWLHEQEALIDEQEALIDA